MGILALGAGGAAWQTAGPPHDPIGALLTLSTTLAAVSNQRTVAAYSYILEARQTLGSYAKWSWRVNP